MRTRAVAAVLAAILALAGCASSAPAPADTASGQATVDAVLASHDLAGLDARELIDRLDAMPLDERPTDLMASIRPHEVLLSAGEAQESVPIPDDAFYVSVAPFVDHTHDCFFHSLTTCRGEMADTELHITVTDGDAVVFDDTVRTFDNGFAGLWLPRGIEGEITITSPDGTATAPISTGDDAPTCVTTIQLT